MKIISSTIIFLLLSTAVIAETIVDIPKIAGKSKKEVSSILGKESSCGKSKYGETCQYKKGETEIVYINGKADWITVEGIDNVPFSPKALTSIGLNKAKPSFQNNFTIRWSSIQGLMEVSIFKGASLSDYAYIKVRTK